MPQSSPDSNTTLIHDSPPENHATLIRDIENASQSIPPSHAPNRRLDFTDESDVLQIKRVTTGDEYSLFNFEAADERKRLREVVV